MNSTSAVMLPSFMMFTIAPKGIVPFKPASVFASFLNRSVQRFSTIRTDTDVERPASSTTATRA